MSKKKTIDKKSFFDRSLQGNSNPDSGVVLQSLDFMHVPGNLTPFACR